MADGSDKMSMGDIAASIVQPPKTPDSNSPIVGEQDDAQDQNIVESDVQDDEQDDDDQSQDAGQQELSDEESNNILEDENEDEVDKKQPTEGEDEPTPLEVTDDDVIEVMIDGKLETRTLGELKQAISGEGAIEKRLQEATEERKRAKAERAKVETDSSVAQQALVEMIQTLDSQIFAPRVNPPEQALRQSNPQQYLAQEDAYNQEQKRIEQGRQQLAQAFQAQAAQVREGLNERRKEAAKQLREALPVLNDPKLGPTRKEAILNAARHYGFTDEEISLAADHRMFLMAHDAAMYRASQEKREVKNHDDNSGAKRPQRVLRSGKTTAKKRATASQKKEAAARKKAAESGRPQDIAPLLIERGKRGR